MLRFSLVLAVAMTSTMAVSSVLAASPQGASTVPAHTAPAHPVTHHPAQHAKPNAHLASREAALRAGQRKTQAHRRTATGTAKAAGAHGVSKTAAARAHRSVSSAPHRAVTAKAASPKNRACLSAGKVRGTCTGHAAVHGPSAKRGAASAAHVRHARAATKAPAKKV